MAYQSSMETGSIRRTFSIERLRELQRSATLGRSTRTGRAEGAWSRGGAPLTSVALLLIGPDLVVQQADQAPRDPLDGPLFKTRKDVPDEVSRPRDPPLIPRPHRGAEFGEVQHHADRHPHPGLHTDGERVQRLPSSVHPRPAD